MVRIRSPKELEDKINFLAKQENVTKTDIVKEAVEKGICLSVTCKKWEEK